MLSLMKRTIDLEYCAVNEIMRCYAIHSHERFQYQEHESCIKATQTNQPLLLGQQWMTFTKNEPSALETYKTHINSQRLVTCKVNRQTLKKQILNPLRSAELNLITVWICCIKISNFTEKSKHKTWQNIWYDDTD